MALFLDFYTFGETFYSKNDLVGISTTMIDDYSRSLSTMVTVVCPRSPIVILSGKNARIVSIKSSLPSYTMSSLTNTTNGTRVV